MPNLLSIANATTDMTQSEMDKVAGYKSEGLPGIVDITNNELYRMYDLYLSGSTYTQIANTLKIKKVMILYLAHHNKWFESKQEFINELQEKIKARVIETKLRTSEFMLLTVQAYQKRISNKFTRYLATNDDKHMDEVDLKELAQLMKAIEIVNELDNTGKDSRGKSPAVGLNLGNGVTVEREGDNKITITPKEPSIGETLKQYAEEKKRLQNQSSDIGILKGEDDAK